MGGLSSKAEFCGPIDVVDNVITQYQPPIIPRGQTTITPRGQTTITRCKKDDGVYEIRTNMIYDNTTYFAIPFDDIWAYAVNNEDGKVYIYMDGKTETKFLKFGKRPQLMFKKENNYYTLIANTDLTSIIKVTQGKITNTQEVTPFKNTSINKFKTQSGTFYITDILQDTMPYIYVQDVENNKQYKIEKTENNTTIEYDYLKLVKGTRTMFAYAMPPSGVVLREEAVGYGGSFKKKTSTKTKTQAKHTFMHGKKTYTRVIHLGKRGGKYVMLNGELVPIYKLQTSS